MEAIRLTGVRTLRCTSYATICCISTCKMSHRPTSELIQSLRVTLQKLEENFASLEDQPVMAELKRILLLRIADIEAVDALQEAEASEVAPEPTVTASEAHPVDLMVEQSLEPTNACDLGLTESASDSITTA